LHQQTKIPYPQNQEPAELTLADMPAYIDKTGKTPGKTLQKKIITIMKLFPDYFDA
jgi:hypothetical protein